MKLRAVEPEVNQSDANLGSESSEIQTPEATTNKVDFENPKRSTSLVSASWLLVVLVVFGVAGFVASNQFFSPRSLETSSSELLQINLTAKMLLGFPQPEATAMQQISQFDTGPLEQRFAHAILVNELSGAEKAIAQMARIEEAVNEKREALGEDTDSEVEFPTANQVKLRKVLDDLFRQFEQGDFDTSGVSDDDRELLKSKLGWIANLALHPKKSQDKQARKEIEQVGFRTFGILAIATLVGILALLAAVVAGFVILAMLATRQYKVHFTDPTSYGFVYIETFAFWILIFFGLQFGMVAISQLTKLPSIGLVLGPTAFFGSLIALVWPVMRGVPFRQLCRDIGWELKNPFVEIFIGGFSYLALIIPMVVGISISVILGLGLSLMTTVSEFESSGPVGHPIAEEIASGGPLVWISIFVSACIAAPIVEETMFRGVLYRYLRDATSRPSQARWISVIISSFISSLIFATIHPQGLVGIPVLMTLAIGFSFVREWRNSLIGPMLMHAINNSIVTCLLIAIVV